MKLTDAKILRVNLSNGKISTENVDQKLLKLYFGGRGLASKILAHSVRQLPGDFERQYGRRPLLVETLVDANLFSGTCYRAANWILLGQTRGRGRMDRYNQSQVPKKLVYVYPLCHSVQQRLRESLPR